MNKNKKGFTLIELLIVVAIIGILAVALVPTISDAPGRARDAARKTLVNSVITAVESYNIDQSEYPADTFCLDGTDAGSTEDDTLIDDYLNGKEPASQGSATAPTTASTTLPDGCDIAVYYIGGASVYTVGILLEGESGNSDNGTTDGAAGGRYFVVNR